MPLQRFCKGRESGKFILCARRSLRAIGRDGRILSFQKSGSMLK